MESRPLKSCRSIQAIATNSSTNSIERPANHLPGVPLACQCSKTVIIHADSLVPMESSPLKSCRSIRGIATNSSNNSIRQQTFRFARCALPCQCSKTVIIHADSVVPMETVFIAKLPKYPRLLQQSVRPTQATRPTGTNQAMASIATLLVGCTLQIGRAEISCIAEQLPNELNFGIAPSGVLLSFKIILNVSHHLFVLRYLEAIALLQNR